MTTHGLRQDSGRVPLGEVRDLLCVGSEMPFRVLDAQHTLLLNQGQQLVDEAQLDSLIERGAWAERHLVDAERAARADAARRRPAPSSLFDRWAALELTFDKLCRALARRQGSIAELPAVLGELDRLLDADPDAVLFLCVRQDGLRPAQYPYVHPLHCAAIALLAGRQLGWDAAALGSLGAAALTMNLAIADLQAELMQQEQAPSLRQVAELRTHPQRAVALLQEAGIDDAAWLGAVADHHEREGGGGYPTGKTEVGDAARRLRGADVFMAKLAARAMRPGVTPHSAVRQLFQQRPGDALAMALVRTLGAHPPGSLVKLHSGEIAVSTRRPARGTQPIVATLSDKTGKPSAQTHRRDTADPAFAIEAEVTDTRAFARVLPERVYGVVELNG